jgi:hypothetical protein
MTAEDRGTRSLFLVRDASDLLALELDSESMDPERATDVDPCFTLDLTSRETFEGRDYPSRWDKLSDPRYMSREEIGAIHPDMESVQEWCWIIAERPSNSVPNKGRRSDQNDYRHRDYPPSRSHSGEAHGRILNSMARQHQAGPMTG